jgi:hypothetical protein
MVGFPCISAPSNWSPLIHWCSNEDSTFRLHVVLLTARLLLTRFDTWVRA